MTAKKRKPRIVTEATKAKLPKPRKCKAVGTMPDEFYENRDLTGPQGPRPRKRRPLPDLSIVGVEPAPDFLVVPIPCMDWPADSLPSGDVRVTDAAMLEMVPRDWHDFQDGRTTLPDTAPYPWPLEMVATWLCWVDERIVAARKRLAAWLRALSRKVAP